jgi:hypothetical protein
MHFRTFVLALWCLLNVAHADFGLHSEVHNPETGGTIQILAEGYTGEVFQVLANTTFTPSRTFKKLSELDVVEERDVCQMITNCYGQCADTLTTFKNAQIWATIGGNCASLANSLNNYLSANNYANANSIIQGALLNIVFNIATTPVTWKMNAALDLFFNGGNQDACGETQAPAYTGDAASAIYQFCLAIQSEVETAVTTRFDAADSASASATSSLGSNGLAKFFVAQQAGIFAPICNDYGITWRKRASQALRWALRSPSRGIDAA